MELYCGEFEMTINTFAGKRWVQCDRCGELISGEKPTKEDIQKSTTLGGFSMDVYSMCDKCSKNKLRRI